MAEQCPRCRQHLFHPLTIVSRCLPEELLPEKYSKQSKEISLMDCTWNNKSLFYRNHAYVKDHDKLELHLLQIHYVPIQPNTLDGRKRLSY